MCNQLTRGTLIVVGGHSRHVGKTSTVERLLQAHADRLWVAIKVSAHRHAAEGETVPTLEEMRDRSSATQTGRFLRAGAARAFLARAPDAALSAIARFIESLRDEGSNVIVESNRLVRFASPDVLVFVVDPLVEDWKESSADCIALADAFVCRRDWDADPQVAQMVQRLAIERPVFMDGDPQDRCRFARWCEAQMRDRQAVTHAADERQ